MAGHGELMRLHVEALFTHDADGRLLRVNALDGGPAPRFFLGRTRDGVIRRFRHDLAQDLRCELEAASQDEMLRAEALDEPMSASRYENILARFAPVQRTWTGPAFCFPAELRAASGARIT